MLRVFIPAMKQLQKAVVLVCLGILPLLLIITRLTAHSCTEAPSASNFYGGSSTVSKPARSGPGPPSIRPKTQPIDVVYTWVNGSDPNFIRSLKKQVGKIMLFCLIGNSKCFFKFCHSIRGQGKMLSLVFPYVLHNMLKI